MKSIFSIAFLTVIVVFLSQCKSKDTIPNVTKSDVVFSLSKGVCFGSCPVYSLDIYHGGYATFTGLQHTKNLGKYAQTLDAKTYNELVKAFKAADFDSFPDEFKSNIPDLPLITIGFHNGTEFRTVKGKEDRPESLMQLQFMLEKVVDGTNWEYVKNLQEVKKEMEPEPSYIYQQIIIEPTKGTLLNKWLETQKEYGTRLVKKIAPALDYYLIEYDTNTIKPTKYLRMLQDDPAIKTAEFNKRTTQRG